MPKMKVSESQVPGRYLSHEGGAPMNNIDALLKDAPES